MNEHYHLYDQGLFNYLIQGDLEKIQQFIESANVVLNKNLYDYSFTLVPRPFTFIEAIGFSDFFRFIKINENITKEEVFLLKDEEGQCLYQNNQKKLDTFFNEMNPSITQFAWLLYYPLLINIRAYNSLRANHEFEVTLIKKAMQQIKYIQKCSGVNISSDLIDGILQEPLQLFQRDSSTFKDEIFQALAAEFTQQFDYETSLASYIPDISQRKEILKIIYHNIISEAVRNISIGVNGSYIRGLDKAYRYLSNNKIDEQYLKNNKDLVDGNMIDLAIRGYNGQSVHIFTMDSRNSVILRLNRAIQVLNWASEFLNIKLLLNKGFIYFVDKNTLQIMKNETIDVSMINPPNLIFLE